MARGGRGGSSGAARRVADAAALARGGRGRYRWRYGVPVARFGASLLLSLVVATGPTTAQQPRRAARRPTAAGCRGSTSRAWLYKGSDLVQDKDWRFGTLPNGLRYAVRRNGVPPGQVAVRVRIDAGSLHETDSERGFAHFIEHLSFRGSEYVPDSEAKRIWQRFGATFGSDSNAQTTPVVDDLQARPARRDRGRAGREPEDPGRA